MVLKYVLDERIKVGATGNRGRGAGLERGSSLRRRLGAAAGHRK